MKKHLFILFFLFMGCNRSDFSITPSLAQDWQPERVLAQGTYISDHPQLGVYIGDQELLIGSQVDSFLVAIRESGIDILELRLWHIDLGLINTFLEKVHYYDLEVAINFWTEYPGLKDVPEKFKGKRLSPEGEIVEAIWSDGGSGVFVLDIANPEAVNWMANNLANFLSSIEADYFLFDEDKINPWANLYEWPKYVYYYDAPLYSDHALKSFRRFMYDSRARFPVHNWKLTERHPDKLTIAIQGSWLWQKYFEWRAEVFAQYLEVMAKAANSQVKHGTIYMTWQRLIDECYFIGSGSKPWTPDYFVGVGDNKVFAVSYETMAQRCPSISTLIIKYVEDGTHPDEWTMTENEKNTAIVHQICRNYGKNFGTFIQFYNYDSGTKVVNPQVVIDEWELAKKYNAKIVVIYDVATLYTGSIRHDQQLKNTWREITESKR